MTSMPMTQDGLRRGDVVGMEAPRPDAGRVVEPAAVEGGGAAPRPRKPSQGVALCLAMLKGSLIGSHLALLVAVAGGYLHHQGIGAANAAIAAALVIIFFASGQAVQLLAAEAGGGMGLALVLGSYGLRVVALAVLLWFATAHQDRLEASFDRTSFVVGVLLVAVGWLAGVLVANARAHVFVYDRDHDAIQGRGGSV